MVRYQHPYLSRFQYLLLLFALMVKDNVLATTLVSKVIQDKANNYGLLWSTVTFYKVQPHNCYCIFNLDCVWGLEVDYIGGKTFHQHINTCRQCLASYYMYYSIGVHATQTETKSFERHLDF